MGPSKSHNQYNSGPVSNSPRNHLRIIALGGVVGCFIGVNAEVLGVPPSVDNALTPICAPPSPRAIEAVEHLASLPRNHLAVVRQAAHMRRVHQELKKLRLIGTTTQRGVVTYLNAADQILAPYHVEITETSGPQNNNAHTANSHITGKTAHVGLNSTERYDVERTITGISELPVSYVHFSGLKKVIPYEEAPSITTAYVDVINSTPEERTIVNYNMAYAGLDSTVKHEIGHLVDAKECSNGNAISYDPAFEALNHTFIYNGNRPSEHVLSNNKLSDAIGNLEDREGAAERVQNHRFYEKLRHKLIDLFDGVTSISSYSLSGVAEDKAEIYSKLGNPYAESNLLNPVTPNLRAKFIFLMARLYERTPLAVRQILATAYRPNSVDMYFEPTAIYSKSDTEDTYKSDVISNEIGQGLDKVLKKLPRPKEPTDPNTPHVSEGISCAKPIRDIVHCKTSVPGRGLYNLSFKIKPPKM